MKIAYSGKSDSPIWDGVSFKNLIFAAAGGGGQSVGLPNQILILDGKTFEEVGKFPTEELYEHLFVSEVEEYLIAISENLITLFKIQKKSLLKNYEVKIDNQFEDNLISHFFNHLLYVSDGKKFKIYKVTKHASSLNEIHNEETDKEIVGFCGISQRETIVAFKKETVLFSVPNKTYGPVICTNPSFKKLLLSRRSEEEFLLAYSNPNQTQLLVYSKNHSEEFVDVVKLKLGGHNCLRLSSLDTLAVLSTPNGEVVIVYLNTYINKLNLVKVKKFHELPITTLLMRRTPTTEGSELDLNLVTFSYDYKVFSLSLKPE